MKLSDRLEAIKEELPLDVDMGQVKRVTIENKDMEVDVDLGYTPESRMGDFEVEYERTEYGWHVKNIFQPPL
ncbi:MAG: hypothetical protein ACO1OQ_02040 [Rufibacter sp.]